MNDKNIILGIDPGISGAIAALNVGNEDLYEVWDMPIHPSKTKNRKNDVDAADLGLIISGVANRVVLAIVEKVNAGPKDGTVNAFRFGEAFGIIQGVLGANLIPIIYLHPAIWKSQLNLNRDKNKSLHLAREMFPKKASYFKRMRDDGRAEAALLASLGLNFI